jgi:hypothetical protein
VKKRFWVSWEEPDAPKRGSDYRPLTDPPDNRIRHWWCSGYGEGFSTLCAVVDANDEADVRKGVESSWTWRGGWRIFQEVEPNWMPDAGRFPVS